VSIRARKPGRAALACALLALAAVFAALGVWQVERREWKHVFIAKVGQRVHADPVDAPPPGEWSRLTADSDAYRRVRIEGRLMHERETLVRAVSDLGSGYWVLTPVNTGEFTVLVNRGFILPAQRAEARRSPAGKVTVIGLLRMSEPDGGFLRRNDPAAGNWYSRDVSAIAKARGVTGAAPYFIDANAALNARGRPIGGLTVVRFTDNHAVYALTWFAMALMSLWAASFVLGLRLWRPRPQAAA
jgi:surfeit locus 1 family protein